MSPSPDPDELYTTAEAAKFLKVARHRIYRLIEDGELPHASNISAGSEVKHWRIPRRDLDGFLERRRIAA